MAKIERKKKNYSYVLSGIFVSIRRIQITFMSMKIFAFLKSTYRKKERERGCTGDEQKKNYLWKFDKIKMLKQVSDQLKMEMGLDLRIEVSKIRQRQVCEYIGL